jgi:polysaccharide pyruvyl transferase WcaK-like protein
MGLLKVLLIHVGNLNNKGTQALLKSDVSLVKEIFSNAVFSVSTTDVEGVARFGCFERVLSAFIDIPYEKADFYAKRLGFSRDSWRYKVFAFACLFWMFVELLMAAMSTVMIKIGLKPFYRAALLEEIKESDVVISYSDENFKEGATFLPSNVYWVLSWWSMLISRAWIVLAVKFLGKRLVMFPNSVGGFQTWVGRSIAKLALNKFDYILVREPCSLRTVTLLGVKVPVLMAADTTLLLKANKSGNFSGFRRPLMSVSLGVYSHTLSEKGIKWFVNVCSRALDCAVEKYGFNVVFLPHYVCGFRFDDLEISKLIYGSMKFKDRARIMNPLTLEEYMALLSEADIVLSSKMHPAVLATASHVPTLCIVYDDKQAGFYEQLGLSDCTLPVTRLSSKSLLSTIDHVWSCRDNIKTVLNSRIPELKERIRLTVKMVLTQHVKNAAYQGGSSVQNHLPEYAIGG